MPKMLLVLLLAGGCASGQLAESCDHPGLSLTVREGVGGAWTQTLLLRVHNGTDFPRKALLSCDDEGLVVIRQELELQERTHVAVPLVLVRDARRRRHLVCSVR